MPELDPDKFLSDKTLSRVTFALRGKEKNLNKQAFLLKDGTVIMIEKPIYKNPYMSSKYIDNPTGINIVGPCKVYISYRREDADEDNEMAFEVKNFQELTTKWAKYKQVSNLPEDLEGTLTDISLTKAQNEYVVKLEDVTNVLLNLLMETDIELGPDDYSNLRLMERYELINFVLANLSKNLVQTGIAKQIHLPHIVRNDDGESVELREHIDKSSFERMDFTSGN